MKYLTNNPGEWRVRVGEHNMAKDEEEEEEDVGVEKIIFHPARDG